MERGFDAIIIGSGVGGLTAAAALAHCGRRVLVLEQHSRLGGLTQTFRRGKYTFATGVHYIGGLGEDARPENQFGRTLRWLTDGRLRFAPLDSPYDIVRLPGFEFGVEAPKSAYVERLKSVFPGEQTAIERYFAACDEAIDASLALFAARAAPAPLGAAVRWLKAGRIERSLGTTTAEAVSGIGNPRLAALLSARWGDYGMPPERSPFAVHALVTGSYFDGAYYPVGGPGRFAEAFGETIRMAGGELRTRARVFAIRIAAGNVAGVSLDDGEEIDAPVVISAMGAHNTLAALPRGVGSEWRRDLESFRPGVSCVALYLGFRGDIRTHGASSANVWIYESEDVGRLWEDPSDEDAPALYVSFPTLKDPAHADSGCHTAELVALCRWEAFSGWSRTKFGVRPKDYQAAKECVEERLLAQFARHFPRLAPLIDFHEASTPLSQASFVSAERGAMYGLEMSAARLASGSLGVRTPVPGLVLAGQDAASPGIQGAFMGGFMAAAALEPRLWRIRSAA